MRGRREAPVSSLPRRDATGDLSRRGRDYTYTGLGRTILVQVRGLSQVRRRRRGHRDRATDQELHLGLADADSFAGLQGGLKLELTVDVDPICGAQIHDAPHTGFELNDGVDG